ncbi:MAG: serine hydrolase domain-containing protein [Pseudomonadota bacterium]
MRPINQILKPLVWLFVYFHFSFASADPLQDIDPFIESSLEEWVVPGAFVSIVKDDKVLLAKGYGVKNSKTKKPVDENTLFSIGSTSKAFAAATIAILVSDGVLSWDDRVRKYVPWLKLYDESVAEQLTIRDMLSGTVGTFWSDENELRALSSDARDILNRAQKLEPRAPFRSGFLYSNNMFILTGELVEAVTGKTWEKFAENRLWRPLGMGRTTASAKEAWATGNAAQGHIFKVFGDGVKPTRYKYCDAVCVPSGGVNTSASDVTQWLRFQLGRGTIDGNEIIPEAIFMEMHQPQTKMRRIEGIKSVYVPFPNQDLDRWGAKNAAYGFGWVMFDYNDERILWHDGGANDCAGNVFLVPEKQIAIFINTNRVSKMQAAMGLTILDKFLGVTTNDWYEEYPNRGKP